ncbi:SMI1/KNR4 family protein [Kordia algicida OT-1]|uniref:Knr4/Smi1-like domain-containing protein n=1 Tax=Kordia algicida OT-1 TaxID=391587 RepID=A9EDS3_9FLAO|nr:SMI1/KNR4 family protein [Kordia algicida]EDP94217.1 hypothetical protein KAOT1_00965 [Kordia algicida OT-1]
MEIQYLKNLENTSKVEYSSQMIEGISEEKIAEYETQLGIIFPLAYKEFLYLAGSYPGYLVLLDGLASIEDLADEEYQAYRQKAYLEPFNFKETRPYWTFATGSQAFWFFYLDEDTEDPIVWQAELYDVGSYDLNHAGKKQTFSEFINDIVDYSKEYYKEMYG